MSQVQSKGWATDSPPWKMLERGLCYDAEVWPLYWTAFSMTSGTTLHICFRQQILQNCSCFWECRTATCWSRGWRSHCWWSPQYSTIQNYFLQWQERCDRVHKGGTELSHHHLLVFHLLTDSRKPSTHSIILMDFIIFYTIALWPIIKFCIQLVFVSLLLVHLKSVFQSKHAYINSYYSIPKTSP